MYENTREKNIKIKEYLRPAASATKLKKKM